MEPEATHHQRYLLLWNLPGLKPRSTAEVCRQLKASLLNFEKADTIRFLLWLSASIDLAGNCSVNAHFFNKSHRVFDFQPSILRRTF